MENKSLTETNFELEQDILKCWNITDDVREIVADFESGQMSQDNLILALKAYADVYDNRFNRTWRRYETVCRGLHDLRATVQGFELAQLAGSKTSKTGKSKKQKPVDNKSE